jgi:hypothetical protein
MAAISGFPYFEIQFTKEGAVFDQDEVRRVLDFAGKGAAEVTDLFVISHGWNNDLDDARALYRKLLARLRERLDAGGVQGLAERKLAVLAVLWPSKKFAEKELIAGGAASLGGPVSTRAVQGEIERVKDAFDSPTGEADLERAKKLVAKLETSPQAQRDFVALLRSLVPQGAADEETPPGLFSLPGHELLRRLSKPAFVAPVPAAGGGASALGSGTAGGAAAVGLLSGIKGGALKLLNFATYYQMKERAGAVGRSGLNAVLRQLRQKRADLKLHLIGHSFGGRLVTAAALGPEGATPVKAATMSLLQAAFSHFGFARRFDGTKDGFFRRVIGDKLVSGPVLVTHTHNDRAVGKAYPIASQIAGQVASALGDANSPYGGIGANGAQKTPETVQGKLLPAGGKYQLAAGKLYNLQADAFIADHSDIAKNEVAHAILSAVAKT